MTYSKEELIEELQRVSEEHCDGETPRLKDFLQKSDINRQDIDEYFDCYGSFCIASELEPYRVDSVNQEKLIQDIKRISREYCNGQTPKREDIEEYSYYGHGTFDNYFKSWNNALTKAGFGVNRFYNLNKEEVSSEIKRISEQNFDGKSFSYREANKYTNYNSCFWKHCFSNLREALEFAGFDVKYDKERSNKELIDELKSLNKRLNRIPTVEDMRKFGKFDDNVYEKRFGTWVESLEAAGFDISNKPGRKISKEEQIKNINKVSESFCSGQPPTIREYVKHGKYSQVSLQNSFGNWNNALREAGFDNLRIKGQFALTGEEHPAWKGGYEGYYGSSWLSQRRKARKRDKNKCRVCSKTKQKIGKNPHIHHITPKRYWDVESEHEKMNSLENLISLCPFCHKKLEGKFKGRNHEEFEKLAKDYLDIDESSESETKKGLFDY